MQKLTPNLHHAFNDRVINLLHQQNVSTISDFLRTDSNKLKQLLNIDLADLVSMKMEFWKFIGISPINGLQHYKQFERDSKCTPTGIASFDNLLKGGLIFGNLIDLCGFSAIGKTQLHTTIAVNWAINYDYETFVIDTKGDFSGERIHSILMNRPIQFQFDRCKQIMRNIRVEKCNNSLNQLIELVQHLLHHVHLYPKLKLLVIDSLASLWFLHHGSKSTNRYRQVATLVDLLRKLAVEHGIVVLAVNIETRLIVNNELIPSPSCDAIDDNDAADTAIEPMEIDLTSVIRIAREINVPALGKHWKTICAIRLQMQRLKTTSTSTTASAVASISTAPTTTTAEAGMAIIKKPNERIIRILKSNQHPANGCCVVHIKDTGVE